MVNEIPIQDPTSSLLTTGPQDVSSAPVPQVSLHGVDLIDDGPLDAWVEVLKRWIPLPTTSVAQTAAVGQELVSIAVWDILNANPLAMAQISNYSILGFKSIKYKVTWTVSSLSRGAILLHAQPLLQLNNDLASIYDSCNTHILTPTVNEVELEVPNVNPNGCFDLTQAQNWSLGLFSALVLSKYVDETNSSNLSNLSVEMQLQDPVLYGHRVAPVTPTWSSVTAPALRTVPTFLPYWQSDAEAARKTKQNSLSSTLERVSVVANAVASVPTPLSPIATAAALLTQAASKTAKIFGFDKPVHDQALNVISALPARDGPSGRGSFEAIPMTLNPLPTTGTDVSKFGGFNDVAHVKKIAQTFSLTSLVTIPYTAAAYTSVASIPVCPSAFRITGSSPPVSFGTNTHAGYVSQFFNCWRGTMEYNFRIFGSKWTSCRLAIVWSPTQSPTLGYLTNAKRTLYDVEGDTSFTIQVPWRNPNPYLYTRMKGDNVDTLPTVNGYLIIVVINPLTVQGQATPVGLSMVVASRMTEDVCFGGTTCPYGAKLTLSNSPSTLQGPVPKGYVADDDIESLLDIGHRFAPINFFNPGATTTSFKILPDFSPNHAAIMQKFGFWRGDIILRFFTPKIADSVNLALATISNPSVFSVQYTSDNTQTGYQTLAIEYDTIQPMTVGALSTNDNYYLNLIPKKSIYLSTSTPSSVGGPTNVPCTVQGAWGDRFCLSYLLPSPALNWSSTGNP